MKQKLPVNKALFAGIALALFIFSVMLWVSQKQKKLENTTTFLIAKSQENLYQTTKLLSHVTDNESGSRGYLITGNKMFLDPLVDSKKNIRQQLELLRSINKDNPSREALLLSLEQFANARIAFSDSTIRLWDEKGMAEATRLVATGRGKLYLDSVREKISEITHDENLLLTQQLKLNDEELEQQQVKLLSVAFVIIVLLLLFTWSEKKRIEQRAYAKSRDELELLSLQINQANDAIYTLDANRIIKSWNLGAERLYGFTKEEAVGMESNLLLKTDISSEEIVKALIELDERMYWTGELERITKSGATVYVTSSTSCVKNNDGVVTGYVSVSQDITAKRKLHEQLNHLANIVEQSSEAIFSRGTDKRIISWNAGAEKLFGYNRAEVIGKSFAELGIFELTAANTAEVENEIKLNGNWKAELSYYRKDGSTFFGAVTANGVQNPQGDTTSFNFIIKDISRRKQLEEELIQTNEELEQKVEERTKAVIDKERNYRYLFQNNPLPMWVVDTGTYKFLDVNETALQHYGYSREEFLSMTAMDIGPADEAEALLKLDSSKTTAKIDNLGIWTHIKKDGTLLTVEVSAHSMVYEKRPALFVLVNDITGKNKAEKQLAASEKRFRALVENNYDIISLLDASFKLIYRSPSATRITGWTDEEIVNAPFTKIIHPEDAEESLKIAKEITGNPGKPVKTLFRSQHKQGHYLWMEGVITNLLGDSAVQAVVLNFRDVTEKIEANKKLASSELRFRSLIENSAEGISLLDAGSNVIYRSPSGYKMLGNNPTSNTIDLAAPENLVLFREKFNESLSKPAQPVKYKVKYRRASGDFIWAEGVFTNLLHLEGVNAVVANYHEVTDRVEAENKLIRSEKRFRSMIENISDAIVLNDKDATILYQSPSVTKILGYSIEERKNTRVTDYIHPDYRNEFINVYKKLDEFPGNTIPFLYKARHKNGNYIWLEGVVTNLTNDPEVNGYVANYRDVTKRKELEERLNRAYTIARIGGWEIDLIKGTVFWSDITREIHETATDFEPDLATGINFYKEGPGRELIIQKVKEATEEGKPWDVELQIITAKNNERWIRSIGETEFANGKCIRIYGSFQDIDNRKRNEEEIKQLNQELEEKIELRTAQLRKSNEDLEAFSYSVSHDLRAPLRAVIGYTTILQEDYGRQLDEEAKRVTEIIKNNTQRMGHLIDDLLTFSRLGKQEITKAAISSESLVKEVISTVLPGEAVNINWILHSLPVVEADNSSLRQVWANLISNAVKYAGKKALTVIEIGSFRESEKIVFYVKDNGVGFNEKYKGKLFKVFQRLHSTEEFEGTGIGLAIVDKIVTKHGGNVWAEATVDKGATFYFSLPQSPGLN